MNKLKKLLCFSALATILFVNTAFTPDYFEIAKQIEIFTTLFKEINMNYVDNIRAANLMNSGIKSMLATLDPYTVYMTEQDVEKAKIRQSKGFYGVGAKIRYTDSIGVVEEILKDGPADLSGVKVGDKIVSINNIKLNKEDSALELLNNLSANSITVVLQRVGKEITTVISPQKRKKEKIVYYKLINDTIGFVALKSFSNNAGKEVKNAFLNLQDDGAKSYVLDLRNNPGGLLNEAVKIVNLFIEKNELVVFTKSINNKSDRQYYTKEKPILPKAPLVVVINNKSASASEIVSGALQDLDRAIVVGQKSFGKGLVQIIKKLPYGTQIKITTSRYYTPSGRCVQAIDYINYDKVSGEKFEENKMFRTKKGRKVKANGGVTPDVRINDSNEHKKIREILNSKEVFEFVAEYCLNNSTDNNLLNNDFFNPFVDFLKTKHLIGYKEVNGKLEVLEKKAKEDDIDGYFIGELEKLKVLLKSKEISLIRKHKQYVLEVLGTKIKKILLYDEGEYGYYFTQSEEFKTIKSLFSNKDFFSDTLNKTK